MSAPLIALDDSVDQPSAPLWAVPDSGLVRVRVAPLVDPGGIDAMLFGADESVTESVLDMQLLVDYTHALARRTAARIRSGYIDDIDHPHQHPDHATCLRCAVLGTSRDVTIAATLLEVLTATGADEEWNCSKSCSDVRLVSRLRRLAVSAQVLGELYGPNWGAVMLTALRIEAADFHLLHHLVRAHDPGRVLIHNGRHSLAAYHLATVVTPWTATGGGAVTPMLRGAVGIRLAVALAATAAGVAPAWLDHLPAPVL